MWDPNDDEELSDAEHVRNTVIAAMIAAFSALLVMFVLFMFLTWWQ